MGIGIDINIMSIMSKFGLKMFIDKMISNFCVQIAMFSIFSA